MRYLGIVMVALCMLMIACGGESGEDVDSKPVEKAEPEVAAVDGEKVFRTYCVTCHGIDGKMGLNGAKDLGLATTTFDERIDQIKNGKGLMTAFDGILNDDEISAVAEYTLKFKTE